MKERRMIRRMLVAVALAAMALAPWAQDASEQIGFGENGRTFTYKAGTLFEVVAVENLNSPWVWKLDSFSKEVIEQDGEPVFKPPEKSSGMTGPYYFRFKAKAPGKTDLKLVLARRDGKAGTPAKTFQVTVVVVK